MTFHIEENQRSIYRRWSAAVATVFLSGLLLVGCVKEPVEEVIEELPDQVETTLDEQPEEEIIDTEDMVEAEEDDEDAIPIVTEVVYDFDSYEEVVAVNPEQYEFDDPIKGIYVSAHAAGSDQWFANIVQMADETEINSFVIDVKNDSGLVCFEVDLEEVNEIGADRKIIRDINGLMDTMYEHDIFPIARIVTFKDPYLAEAKPEYAIKNKDGSLWYYGGVAWLNPYNRDTWKYVVDVAKEAVRVGFKEIQFDYIRFEATSKLNNADFGGLDTVDRETIILEFLDYATEELKPLGVEVTADVFGIIINSERDAKVIGQDYVEMSKRLDAICPMVYPSHYGYGFFGIPSNKHSDLYPYETIYGSMEDSNEELSVIPEGEHVAKVRPWLQSFTASYLKDGDWMVYGREAIRAQIQATYDAGLEEWLLWNAGVKYNSSALLPAENDEEVEE